MSSRTSVMGRFPGSFGRGRLRPPRPAERAGGDEDSSEDEVRGPDPGGHVDVDQSEQTDGDDREGGEDEERCGAISIMSCACQSCFTVPKLDEIAERISLNILHLTIDQIEKMKQYLGLHLEVNSFFPHKALSADFYEKEKLGII